MEIKFSLKTTLDDAKEDIRSLLVSQINTLKIESYIYKLKNKNIDNDEELIIFFEEFGNKLGSLREKIQEAVNIMKEVRDTKEKVKEAGMQRLLSEVSRQQKQQEGEANG